MSSPSRRALIAREIADTEQSYVKSISAVVSILIPAYKPLLTSTQFSSLFCNIESILITQQQFSNAIAKEMTTWDDDRTLLGPIFAQYLPFFKPYKQYSANYDYAQDVYAKLQSVEKFTKAREKVMKEHGPALNFTTDLTHFLIMPVQRIPRYILLLKELINNTTANHPDLTNLQSALKSVEELTTLINDEIKLGQSRAIVRQLCQQLDLDAELVCQPYRYFIQDGVLFKHTPRSSSNPTLEAMFKQFDNKALQDQSMFGILSTHSPKKSPTDPVESLLFPTEDLLFQHDVVQQYQFFLFTDLLIMATRNKSKLTSHHVVPLEDTEIYDPYPTQPTFFVARSNQMTLKLTAPTLQLKKQWFEQISVLLRPITSNAKSIKTNALDVMISSPLDLPTSESSLCASCGCPFSLATHRHTCKYCCEIICDDCAKNYQTVNDTKLRICNICTRLPSPNEQYLTTLSKTCSFDSGAFTIGHRHYLDQFEVLKVAQNGLAIPYRCILFNDLMLLTKPKSGTANKDSGPEGDDDDDDDDYKMFTPPNPSEKHSISQMIPIDHHFKVVNYETIINNIESYQKQKEKNKGKQKNATPPPNTLLSMIANEAVNADRNGKAFPHLYKKQNIFMIQHDTLFLKLYLVSSTPSYDQPRHLPKSANGSKNESQTESQHDSSLKQQKEMITQRLNALALKRSTCLPTNIYRLLQAQAYLPKIESPPACILCDKEFGLLRNPVNCMFCYGFFCKKCSASTAPASAFESIAPCISTTHSSTQSETVLKCCDECVACGRANVTKVRVGWF